MIRISTFPSWTRMSFGDDSTHTCDTSCSWPHSLGLSGLRSRSPGLCLSLGTCRLREPVLHRSTSPPAVTAQCPQWHCHRLPNTGAYDYIKAVLTGHRAFLTAETRCKINGECVGGRKEICKSSVKSPSFTDRSFSNHMLWLYRLLYAKQRSECNLAFSWYKQEACVDINKHIHSHDGLGWGGCGLTLR